MAHPVVQIQQGKYVKLMTWECPFCSHLKPTRHTIAVRPPNEIIPLQFQEPYWPWNGSTTLPTLDSGCITLPCGHNYIKNGRVRTIEFPSVPLKPVKKWIGFVSKTKQPLAIRLKTTYRNVQARLDKIIERFHGACRL